MKKNFVVVMKDHNKRLDAFVAGCTPELSIRKAKALVDGGLVSINGRVAKIASHKVSQGDHIRVDMSQPTKQKVVWLESKDVIAESTDYIVINKPVGLVSQMTKDPHMMHLTSAIKEYLAKKNVKLREPLVLVHRLDKETSGIVFVAKNNRTATWATEQFRLRRVHKRYLAVAYGISKQKSFVEKSHLSEIDKKTGNVRVVQVGGRAAETQFRVLKENLKEQMTLFECLPKTGRSHQIRVHLEHRGMPILGDKRYGHDKRRMLSKSLDRLEELSYLSHYLHAEELVFESKYNGNALTFKAEPPAQFTEVVNLLFGI